MPQGKFTADDIETSQTKGKLTMNDVSSIADQPPVEQSTLSRIWEAANKPLGSDYAANLRNRISAAAGMNLPPSIAGPAAYAANVLTAVPASAVEFGRRMMTPLGVATLGAGTGMQAVRSIPSVPTIVKTGTALAETGLGTAFGLGGLQQAVAPSPEGETGLQEFERRASGAGQALLGTIPVFHALTPTARVAAQEIAGAGREPVAAADEANARRVQEIQKAHGEKVSAAAEKYTQDTQASELKAAQQDREATASFQKDLAEKQAAHADKVAKANEKWLAEAKEAKGLQAEAARVEARKEAIGIAQEEHLKLISDNVQNTHAQLRASLNQRWDAFREAVGPETPIDANKVYEAVNEAKDRFLKGSPQSLKQFNDLTQELGIRKGFFESNQVTMEDFLKLPKEVQDAIRGAGTGMDVDTARIHSSAIGDKRFGGDLPGNVYHALKYVQEALETEIGKVAAQKGQGKVYSKLKSDWHQYQDDWNDMRSLSVGGSPLARVLRAKDPGFVSTQLAGKARGRLLSTFGKYVPFGAAVKPMVRYGQLSQELGTLPKIMKLAEIPERPSIEQPKLPEAPQPSIRELPKRQAIPEPKLPSRQTPQEIRARILQQRAGRPFGWWELFPPYLMEHLLLKSPQFREWVASQPRSGETP